MHACAIHKGPPAWATPGSVALLAVDMWPHLPACLLLQANFLSQYIPGFVDMKVGEGQEGLDGRRACQSPRHPGG